MHLPIDCPICGLGHSLNKIEFSSNIDCNGEPFDSTAMRCSCGHVYLNPRPSEDELEHYYSNEYPHYIRKEAANIDRVKDLIEQKLSKGRFNHIPVIPNGRFLDVGCGLGDIVAAMSELGMKSEGVETSQAAQEICERAGLNVHCETLADRAFQAESFDCISMFHVLEHVDDPIKLLEECRKILKPGGELVVGVPNFGSIMRRFMGMEWVGYQLPTHLHHFSDKSLLLAGDKAGLRTITIDTEAIPQHVETALAIFCKRFLIPIRLTLKFRLMYIPSLLLSRYAEKTRQGDALVVHFKK